MIKFDKTKYPLDHIWEDVTSTNYNKKVFLEVYNVFYTVRCKTCRLEIHHSELNSNHENYETTVLYEDHFYFNAGILYGIPETKYDILIEITNELDMDYNLILSCAEIMIKKLLE